MKNNINKDINQDEIYPKTKGLNEKGYSTTEKDSTYYELEKLRKENEYLKELQRLRFNSNKSSTTTCEYCSKENTDKKKFKELSFTQKCATCAAGVGMASCMGIMTLAMVGIAFVGVSGATASATGNCIPMPGMPCPSPAVGSIGNSGANGGFFGFIISIFLGIWGEVILLVSFAVFITILLLKKEKRLAFFSLVGAFILFASMYIYTSVYIFIPLEALGSVIMAIAYTSMFSKKFALKLRLSKPL